MPVYRLSQRLKHVASLKSASSWLRLSTFPSTNGEGEFRGHLCPTSWALHPPSLSGLLCPVPAAAGGTCPVPGPDASRVFCPIGTQCGSLPLTLEFHQLVHPQDILSGPAISPRSGSVLYVFVRNVKKSFFLCRSPVF